MTDIFKSFKAKEVVYTPRSIVEMEVMGDIQTSQGVYSFKNMRLVRMLSTTKCYLVQYTGDFPNTNQWVDRERTLSRYFMSEEINIGFASVLSVAIRDFKEEQHQSHLNPYSFIYGYVLSRTGVRLHDTWSFEV